MGLLMATERDESLSIFELFIDAYLLEQPSCDIMRCVLTCIEPS